MQRVCNSGEGLNGEEDISFPYLLSADTLLSLRAGLRLGDLKVSRRTTIPTCSFFFFPCYVTDLNGWNMSLKKILTAIQSWR
jgi:hypothetical protein